MINPDDLLVEGFKGIRTQKRIVPVPLPSDVVYWIAHLAVLGMERIREEEDKGNCSKGSYDLLERKLEEYYNASMTALKKK